MDRSAEVAPGTPSLSLLEETVDQRPTLARPGGGACRQAVPEPLVLVSQEIAGRRSQAPRTGVLIVSRP